ncbi:hypothetical protein R3P38DRAFT_2775085 [Favolaschia claudopus]|uniref:F-box domain-containing protein n=1 Tax=Favolaschia claudopus TaxID=2862362 RepID=A0AAW0BVR2_9AGAR
MSFKGQFFTTVDVLHCVLAYLPLISIMSFGQVCRQFRADVLGVTRGRILRYTKAFFKAPSHRQSFFYVLEGQRAWIVGAIPLAVLSFGLEPPVPSCLNVISPYGTGAEWVTLMTKALGFTVTTYSRITGEFTTLGEKYFIFKHQDIPKVVSTYVELTSTYTGVYGYAYAFTQPVMPIGITKTGTDIPISARHHFVAVDPNSWETMWTSLPRNTQNFYSASWYRTLEMGRN